jgi:DNA-binding MarR family transcriptional regulator
MHLTNSLIACLHVVRPPELQCIRGVKKSPVANSRPGDNSIDADGEFALGTSEYFFYLLYLSARQRDLAFDKVLEPLGLTTTRWRTLAIIRRIKPCAMSTLARFSTIERTTLTRAVDQLVEQGLVLRWVPAHDRRQVCLALTEAGEAAYMSTIASLLEFNRRNLEGIGGDQMREANRILQTVLSNIVTDEEVATDLLTFGRPPRRDG